MSVRTMAKVWEVSQHSGTQLLMLLAIADFADDDGIAWPSVDTLAKKCRTTPRNANLVLAALRASGELQVALNQGHGGSNRYRLTCMGGEPLKNSSPLPLKAASPLPLKNSSPPPPEEGFTPPLQEASPPPVAGFPKPLKPASPKPSMNLQPTTRGTTRAASPLACPDDVVPQVWNDWILTRSRKKAEVTHTVIDMARREAEKAGMTFEEFLREWCLRGSQGLKADWLTTRNGAAAPARTGFKGLDYSAGVPARPNTLEAIDVPAKPH